MDYSSMATDAEDAIIHYPCHSYCIFVHFLASWSRAALAGCKQLLLKHDLQHNCLDLYSFFEAIEMLSQKIYKNQEDSVFGDNICQFLDAAVPFFEDFLHQQEQDLEMNKSK